MHCKLREQMSQLSASDATDEPELSLLSKASSSAVSSYFFAVPKKHQIVSELWPSDKALVDVPTSPKLKRIESSMVGDTFK